MACSICRYCRSIVVWKREKGVRMTRIRCPKCGGPIRRLNPEEYRIYALEIERAKERMTDGLDRIKD